MTEQTRDEAMKARVAAIDTPDKAFAALREVAYIGKVFNVEMAATVGQSLAVLRTALLLTQNEQTVTEKAHLEKGATMLLDILSGQYASDGVDDEESAWFKAEFERRAKQAPSSEPIPDTERNT